MEPHKTGYPHLHVALFSDVDMGTQAAIKNLWAKKYQAGSIDHGAQFAVSRAGQSVSSIRNYLMKYMAKGFISTGSKFGEPDTWTAGQIAFYSQVHKHAWRLFGATNDLCKVMAFRSKETHYTEWYSTELLDSEGQSHILWDITEKSG
jgi:hypothetical protein